MFLDVRLYIHRISIYLVGIHPLRQRTTLKRRKHPLKELEYEEVGLARAASQCSGRARFDLRRLVVESAFLAGRLLNPTEWHHLEHGLGGQHSLPAVCVEGLDVFVELGVPWVAHDMGCRRCVTALHDSRRVSKRRAHQRMSRFLPRSNARSG
jgi:hypothetical protein